MLDDKDMAATIPHAPAPPLRDEEGTLRAEFVAEVSAAIEAGDRAAAIALVGELHRADVGDLLEALDAELRPRLVELMGRAFDFTALTEVDDTIREEILAALPVQSIADGIRDMESDDAVYILEDLPAEKQAEILGRLAAAERAALERSLYYPENSAGRRMQTDLIAVPPFWTVGQTIDHMRETADLPDRFYEIYVVDAGQRFLGAVPLDRLLRTKRPVPIAELMEEERHRVRATDDQEEVARLFERYDLVAAPVVDAGDRLVGVITVDDVVDVITEEAGEDIMALGGVKSDEELSDTVVATARSRLPWLVLNMATAFIAASVISIFVATIEAVVAVAVLMPVNAALGGNAGTQALTVAVRALATRDLNSANTPRVILREVMVGVVNGCALALIAGAIAGLAFANAKLGAVLGGAMVVTVIFATTLGILVPLTLNRLKIDPAVASGVFVTTTTDVFGFFTFLGLATIAFRTL